MSSSGVFIEGDPFLSEEDILDQFIFSNTYYIDEI
jgi:hypothetical protein